MPRKRILWGIIGCGEVTERKSGPAFDEVEGSHVVAVMSRNEHNARSYAERNHIAKWYTDAQELIDDPDINAVYVASPPSTHATYAIMAMKAGKPVYVEKPLAASYDDCIRINRVSEQTGVPCFVAYYRRYLPYFQKVKEIVDSGQIGKVMNVQLRFSCPPRDLDSKAHSDMPSRLQAEGDGEGYFFDLAPHQLDLIQYIFGVIVEANGICANREGVYKMEDNVSACFRFENGLPGSASWCFVGHQSSRDDRIEVVGDQGMVNFSVYTYNPIHLYTSEGSRYIEVPNPSYVQLPIIRSVIEHLQGIGTCDCTAVSATPVNWVMDRILGKF